MSKNTRTRILLTAVAALLLVTMAVGGTLAWLTDSTKKITNTFDPSTISVEIAETTEEYKMIPGETIEKDPVITVTSIDVDAWLFVKVEESANFDNFMSYEMAGDWKALTGVDGVYYQEIEKNENAQTFQVLAEDEVTVLTGVTKAMMDEIIAGTADKPTLTFSAYVVQKAAAADAQTAWTLVPAAKTNP